MTNLINRFTVVLLFNILPITIFSQVVDLGAASSFALFTRVGAFNNVGPSVITGDIGTNVGAFSGFPPGIVIGSIHVADAVSAQASADLLIAYGLLGAVTCGQVIGSTLGNDQILTPDVYCIGEAATINGDLYLDAEGDPNAVFIIKIDGALETNTLSNVILINGASACNVWWHVTGAFAVGDFSNFVGTLLGGGAIALAGGSTLNGQALTTAGAVSPSSTVVTISFCPPTITCPVAISVSCANLVPIADPTLVIAEATCPGDVTVTFVDDVVSDQTCDNRFTITRTYMVTDACGLTATCTQTIEVNDQDPPATVTCEATLTISCEIPVPAPNPAGVVAIDACGGTVTVTFVDDEISNSNCPNTFTITRIYLASDDCGNAVTCSQTINVADNTVPVITCPAVTASIECPALPFFPVATATDLCDASPTVTFLDATTPGSCPQEFSVVRIYTATDDCDNAVTCSVSINVTDNTAPILICPTVPATVECPASPVFPAATATDLCDASPVVTFADVTTPGICPQEFIVTRTFTATDACGNATSCIRTIGVTDNTAPVITCPIVGGTIDCSSLPFFPTAIATDACGGIPIITFSDATVPGNCPQDFMLTRTWTATDACGNASTCSRIINVEDNTAPVIVCPVVTTSIECPALPVFPLATATDVCDPNPVVTFLDVTIPGICPQEFSITRTWTAVDACGNAAMCSRTINVTDNTAPLLVCPVVTATVECPALPIFPLATATDLCSPNPMVTFLDATIPGICPQEFSITRTWTAIDACGNATSCSRTINVTDNTAPVLVCPTVIATVECPALPVFPLATATDLCDATPIITFLDATVLGLCPQEFSIVRTWTAVDDCGNASTCSRIISVTDNTAPLIVCPTVTATVECPALPVFPLATATDLCDATPMVTFLDATIPGLCPQEFSIVRTWTAVDDCGNATSCSRTINVTDNTAPVLVCPTVTASVECSVLAVFPLASATDLCDPLPTVTFIDVTTPGLCPQEFILVRTWIAVDACGNATSCSRTINVVDNIAPLLVCPTVSANVECPALPIFPLATATDLCDPNPMITFMNATIPGLCPQEFSIIRTWTAVDACGNAATCSRTINVTDNTAPLLVCPTVTLNVECPAVPVFPLATATDLCDATPIITFLNVTIPGICPQEFSVIRTWTAVDDCGNVSSCSRTINVTDNTAPLITCPVSQTVTCVTDIPSPVVPTAFDLCGGTVTVLSLGDVISNQICANRLTVTRTYRATDACANSATCAQIITVFDNVVPTFVNAPPNITVECFVLPAIVTPQAIDNCTGIVTVQFVGETQVPGVCPTLYTLNRTWRATDVCGNSTMVSQLITVLDSYPPQFTSEPADVLLECNPDFNAVDFQIWLDGAGGSVVSDCSEITWSYTNSPFILDTAGCGNTFRRFIRFIATDECGNTNYSDVSFVMYDITPPIFDVLPESISIECVEGENSDAALEAWLENFGNAVVNDGCGDFTTEIRFISHKPGCGNTFVRTYEFRVTDECGNTDFVRATFSLVDTTPPVIVECPEGDYTLTCEFDVPLPDTLGVVATDNCGSVHISVMTSTQGVGCIYWPMNVSHWYMAKDACGNMVSSCDVGFQVIDSMPPTYTGPDTIEVLCVDDLPGPGELTAILAPYFFDNCYDIICVSDSTPITGPTWVTFVIRAKDLCGNWTEKFSVTFIAIGNCKPLCSVPQGIWGDVNGVINGTSTTEVLKAYFNDFENITVGKFGRTISATSPECVQSLLPGISNTYQFGLGNHVFDSTSNCLQPAKMLNDNGTLRNILAANVIALQLNIWYNRQFNERDLGVQKLVSLPDCLVDPIVMGLMETDLVSVQGLVNLSNNYLAGLGAFPTGFGTLLNEAVSNINSYYQNCQLNNPCQNQVRRFEVKKRDNLYGLSLSPNPVVDEVTIVFEAEEATELLIRFVGGSGGALIAEAVHAVEGYNTFKFSTQMLPTGVYTVVLQSEKGQHKMRMVKVSK